MANDEKGAREKSGRDNKVKYLKNVLSILLLAVIVLTVFGVSFKIGEGIFFVYKTTVTGPLQENVNQNSKEMPPPVAREKTEVKPFVERKLPQSAKEDVLQAAKAEVPPSPSAPVPKVMETETQSAFILVAVANIRSEPNMKSKIISKSKKGERVVILSISDDWLNVKLSSGLTGWVFKILTNMAQPAQKVVPPVAREKTEVKPSVERKLPQSAKEDVLQTAKPEEAAPAVEAPKPVAKQKAASAKAPGTVRKYKVIAGSFSIKANADTLVNQLKENNYEPMVVQAETPKGQFYRVIVGSYSSLSETKTKIGELKKLGFQPFYIVE